MQAERDERLAGPRGRPEDHVLSRHELEERLFLGRVKREAAGRDPVEEETQDLVGVGRPSGRDPVRERSDVPHPGHSSTRREAPDGGLASPDTPGGPMVHPYQRHSGRGRLDFPHPEDRLMPTVKAKKTVRENRSLVGSGQNASEGIRQRTISSIRSPSRGARTRRRTGSSTKGFVKKGRVRRQAGPRRRPEGASRSSRTRRCATCRSSSGRSISSRSRPS